MILLNSVLVATDFGDTSTAALAYGRNLARAFGGRLHVLHVVDQVVATAAAEFCLEDLDERQKAARAIGGEAQLKALLTADDRARLGREAVGSRLAERGRRHRRIREERARGRDCRRHARPRRGLALIVGSVAEDVVRTAPCPVLVVRPNEHEFILPDPVAVHARI